MPDEDSYVSSIRPRDDGSSRFHIPVSVDPQTGRQSSSGMHKVLAIATGVLYILFVVGTWCGSYAVLTKASRTIVATVVAMILIRFVFLGERRYRRSYSLLKKNKNKFGLGNIWGIVSVESEYPYIVHFKNRAIGLFALMENDVIVGKPENDEFLSYEALGNAYKAAYEYDIDIMHIDMMDFIGKDNRLQEAKRSMSANCQNPQIRDLMTKVYNNLQVEMNENVTTYDVYVFTSTKLSADLFKYNVSTVLRMMTAGNYSGWHYLDQDELGNLAKSMFNLGNFSVQDALTSSYTETSMAGIKVLSVRYSDGYLDVKRKPFDELTKEAKENKKSQKSMKDMQARHRRIEKESRKAKKRGNGRNGSAQNGGAPVGLDFS